jgi:hypothetical protein
MITGAEIQRAALMRASRSVAVQAKPFLLTQDLFFPRSGSPAHASANQKSFNASPRRQARLSPALHGQAIESGRGLQ